MQTDILKKKLKKFRITFVRKGRYNCVKRCRTKDKNVMEGIVEKEILKDIEKTCTGKEKLLIHFFRKTFIKIYKIGICWGFNNK